MVKNVSVIALLLCVVLALAQSIEKVEQSADIQSIEVGDITVDEVIPERNLLSVHTRMNFQGYLTDNSGNPMSGNIPMRFSIWDAYSGGNRIWGYEYDTVSCSNGLFNYLIGGKVPINPSVFTGGSYRTLEITVYSTTMPRIVIASVGYAFMAGKADSAASPYNTDRLEGYHGGTTGANIYPRTDASSKLNTAVIPAITSSMIQDGAVANADLASNAVNSAKIQDGTVGNADLASNAVNSAKIQDGTVTSADIQNYTIQPEDMGFSTGTGDITAVYADNGLTGGATSGDAHIHVGAGTGIAVSADAVSVQVPLNLSGSSTSYIIRGYNSSTGAALTGVSSSGRGVFGQSDGSSEGVYGNSSSGYGVYGYSNSNRGVYGNSYSGIGVYGSSGGSYGGYFSTSASYAAVYGSGTSRGIWGRASNTSGDRHGGYFLCSGGAYSWAAYTFSGGSRYRLMGNGDCVYATDTRKGPTALFSTDCPEPMIEDFGHGRLQNGHARIELDPLLLDCITTDGDHPLKVFIQLNDNCNGVYVKTNQEAFDVHELQNGTSNAAFTYRVVAYKRNSNFIRFPDAPAPMEMTVEGTQ